MIRQDYVDFLEKFEGLKKSRNKKDLKDILIATMQDLQIEFAEQRLDEAKLHLSFVKSRIYKR
jgi:hypothetical protein